VNKGWDDRGQGSDLNQGLADRGQGLVVNKGCADKGQGFVVNRQARLTRAGVGFEPRLD
jgi:hypothetical protein